MILNAIGADDGLGVDDFSITASGGPVAVEARAWTAIKSFYR